MGFSTSSISGNWVFKAANMASAASRSPGAVHQWKISNCFAGGSVVAVTTTCTSTSFVSTIVTGVGAGPQADSIVAVATSRAIKLYNILRVILFFSFSEFGNNFVNHLDVVLEIRAPP